jgi:hypothetical protein
MILPLPLVIYSHTDYQDILEIQTDFVEKIENKYLIINNRDNFSEKQQSIIKKYKKVIFYDDSLPYASRLLSLETLKKLDIYHIILLHDIDILLNLDVEKLNCIFNVFLSKNLDRMDLKKNHLYDPSVEKKELCDKEILFFKEEKNFIYNVNPSIWKLSCLMEIMDKFKHKNYRNIEDSDVQQYCKKFNVYHLFSEKYINCGWYACLSFFVFLHITHYGGLLPFSNNETDEEINLSYHKIIEKYKNSLKKKFRTTMH